MFSVKKNSTERVKMVWWLSSLANGNPYIWKDDLYIETGPHGQMVLTMAVSLAGEWIQMYKQSGTKPNLVAKILATKFGSFLWYI